MIQFRKRWAGLVVPLAVGALVACEAGSPTAAPQPGRPNLVLRDAPLDETPDNVAVWNNHFKLCKVGPAEYTPSFRVVEVRFPGTPEEVSTEEIVQVAPGTCKIVASNSDDPIVKVTELPQDGYQVDYIDLRTIGYLKEAEFGAVTEFSTQQDLYGTDHVEHLIGRTASGIYPQYSHVGVVAIYHNQPYSPPTEGSQGCTPGYWKQSQHFDSWRGYTPTQLFSSVFEDAFPGMTLQQVLAQGGGGLNALGRHTVAALLNSSSGGVDYGMSPAQVVQAFNKVYPGSKSDYEGLKDQFAARNERSCPLN